MMDRARPAGGAPSACPFIALDDDRDRRGSVPDVRHRCFADSLPQLVDRTQQATYCLTPGFTGCPIFLAWAARAAAAPVPDGGVSTWAAPPPWVVAPDLRTTVGLPRPIIVAPPAEDDGTPFDDLTPPRGFPAAPVPSLGRDMPAGPVAPAGPVLGHATPASGPVPVAPPPIPAFLVSSPAAASGRPTPGALPGDGAAGPVPLTAPGIPLQARDVPVTLSAGPAALTVAPPLPIDGAPPPLPPLPVGAAPAGAAVQAADADSADPVSMSAEDPDQALPRRDRPLIPVDAGAPSRFLPQTSPAPPRRIGSGEWEGGRRFAAYPTIGSRVRLPSVSPILLGFVALVIVAAILFLLPGFLFGSGGTSPSASPTLDASHAAGLTAPTHTPAPERTARPYIVKKGDTLFAIGSRFGVTVEQLQCANGIKKNSTLSIGQELIIPPESYRCPPKAGKTPKPSPSP